jgi:FMN phosphatase YigB (HAD superfamily)
VIEKIIFDYGGVFTKGSRADSVMRSLGRSKEKHLALQKFFESNFTRQAAEGKWSTNQFVSRLQAHLGEEDPNRVHDVLTQACEPDTQLLGVLSQLKGRYRIFILSDSLPPYSEYLVREFTHIVDALFLSDQMGARKSGQLYNLAETAFPGLFINSVYIDDREPNLLPAKSRGAVGLLFKSTEDLIQDLHKLGVNVGMSGLDLPPS